MGGVIPILIKMASDENADPQDPIFVLESMMKCSSSATEMAVHCGLSEAMCQWVDRVGSCCCSSGPGDSILVVLEIACRHSGVGTVFVHQLRNSAVKSLLRAWY